MATTTRDRIIVLDVIRGVAVMGIFAITVTGMAMTPIAYQFPPAFGFSTVADKLVWFVNFVLFETRMRALFSILFGASMLLVIQRAVEAGKSGWKVHFPRMATLLLFGLAHIYFLWWGDILASYALTGAFAYLFWACRTRTMLVWAACLLITNIALTWGIAILPTLDVIVAARAPDAGPAAMAAYADLEAALFPSADALAEGRAVRESSLTYAADQARTPLPVHLLGALQVLPETLGFMLLGMVLLRTGFITGSLDDRTYKAWAWAGVGGGALVSAILGAITWSSGFAPEWPLITKSGIMPLYRPLMAMGYAGLVILAFRRIGALGERIAAVGRTAFTNYLGTSILASFVFFGHGLGLYNTLSRAESWLLVPLFWLLMLSWSPWWLERFRYGPLEWLWRCLSRARFEPMRKPATA